MEAEIAGLGLAVGEEATMARTAKKHGTRGGEMLVGQCRRLGLEEGSEMRRLGALTEAG